MLTFAKNNCITDLNACSNEELQDAKRHSKTISFVFNKGNLEDYFITTCGAELEMDEEDKAFIESGAKGLGKELQRKPIIQEYGEWIFRIYRTKE